MITRTAVTIASYTYKILTQWSTVFCRQLGIHSGIGKTIIDSYVHFMLAASIIPRLKALFLRTSFSIDEIQYVFSDCSAKMARALYSELGNRPNQVLLCGWDIATSDLPELVRSSQRMLMDTFGNVLAETGHTLHDRLHVSVRLQNWNIDESVVQMIENTFREPKVAANSLFDRTCVLASNFQIPQKVLKNLGCGETISSSIPCEEISHVFQTEFMGAAKCVATNTLHELEMFAKRTTVQMDFFSTELFQLGVIYLLLVLLIAIFTSVGRQCRR